MHSFLLLVLVIVFKYMYCITYATSEGNKIGLCTFFLFIYSTCTVEHMLHLKVIKLCAFFPFIDVGIYF